MSAKQPFLMRFLEREAESIPTKAVRILPGTMSNPKEEAPRPEETKKGPWGD